tara:strand:- start:20735 stop:21973 length:1239 start_codon:yes stop_codon:yes gene_type:complete
MFEGNSPGFPWVTVEAVGDTASVSVCYLNRSNQFEIASESVHKSLKFSSVLLPLIKKLLLECSYSILDIKGMVLVNGPGSFTGIRVSNSLIHGISSGLSCPVVSLSTFELFTFAWLTNNFLKIKKKEVIDIEVILDARMGEYYYSKVSCKKTGSNARATNDNIVTGFDWKVLGCSPGEVLAHKQLLKENNCVRLLCPDIKNFRYPKLNTTVIRGGEKHLLSDWATLAMLGRPASEWSDPGGISPLYLRDKVARTKEERENFQTICLLDVEKEDLSTLFLLEKEAYSFGWSERNFEDSLEAGYKCKKLIDNNLLVGYYIWMKADEECHLLNFTVASARQKRGLGKWMLVQLLDSLKKLNFRSIYLEVRQSNQDAIRLYGKNGFEIIGRRKDYYPDFRGREDALVMKRIILSEK